MNDKQQIFVSIIVPIYNTPLHFFKECLDSLTSQTLKKTEFLLIFDGENNELFSFSKQYQEKDSRFVLSIQPHKGVSATRNFGLKQSQGEYITFVDADDFFYRKSSLEHAYEIIQKNHSDITLFDWIQKGKELLSLWPHSKESLLSTEKEECLKQLINIQNPAFSGAPWAKFFKRSFLNENNITFNLKCPIGQDRVFNYRAFSAASKIAYIKEIIYVYVTNKESAIQRFRPDFLPVILNYIEELSALSNNKYLSLIGKETLSMFYLSWNRYYMHPKNKNSYFKRMKEVSDIVISNRFQNLIKSVDTTNRSFLFKVETWLFQHKKTFPILLHGIKFSIMKLYNKA